MAEIHLNNVSVEFPVYNVSARSFKKDFLRIATGGSVSRDAKSHVVVKSLNDISLSIKHGDRIGLIGHNGSGKSTLLKLLARIYEPSDGQILINGHVSPMLNIMHGIEGEFTGFENIYIQGTILGMSRKEIEPKVADIVAFSGLGDYLSMPVRTYSAGMQVRLAFSIATSIRPDILLIDEIFGAGDSSFMTKARERMVTLLNQSSIVVMATHSDELIKEFCNKALLLEGGKIKFYGNTQEALARYQEKKPT